MWGAVIFCVEHRGIEPTEVFSNLVSGGSQGAVASGGGPLGAYFVISKDLGGMFGWVAHFYYSSVPPTLTLLVTNIRAKSPTAGIEAETIFTFIVKREAFIAANFS